MCETRHVHSSFFHVAKPRNIPGCIGVSDGRLGRLLGITSNSGQKHDWSSCKVYLSVNNHNAKANKMQPTVGRQILNTFQECRLFLCKIYGLLRPQILETEIHGLSWFLRTWTNPKDNINMKCTI